MASVKRDVEIEIGINYLESQGEGAINRAVAGIQKIARDSDKAKNATIGLKDAMKALNDEADALAAKAARREDFLGKVRRGKSPYKQGSISPGNFLNEMAAGYLGPEGKDKGKFKIPQIKGLTEIRIPKIPKIKTPKAPKPPKLTNWQNFLKGVNTKDMGLVGESVKKVGTSFSTAGRKVGFAGFIVAFTAQRIIKSVTGIYQSFLKLFGTIGDSEKVMEEFSDNLQKVALAGRLDELDIPAYTQDLLDARDAAVEYAGSIGIINARMLPLKTALLEGFNGPFKQLSEDFNTMFDDPAVEEALSNIGETVGDTLLNVFHALFGDDSETTVNILNDIDTVLESIGDFAVGAATEVKNMVTWLSDFIGADSEAWEAFMFGAGQWAVKLIAVGTVLSIIGGILGLIGINLDTVSFAMKNWDTISKSLLLIGPWLALLAVLILIEDQTGFVSAGFRVWSAIIALLISKVISLGQYLLEIAYAFNAARTLNLGPATKLQQTFAKINEDELKRNKVIDENFLTEIAKSEKDTEFLTSLNNLIKLNEEQIKNRDNTPPTVIIAPIMTGFTDEKLQQYIADLVSVGISLAGKEYVDGSKGGVRLVT